MGLTSAQIDALIGKYVALANQPDIVKHVDVIVTTRNRTEGPAAGVFNPTRGMGQIRQFNRYGGLYEHAAAGLLRDSDFYSERPEGRYMIAERGTGGEAFVAKNAPDMRSLAIADVAARWHGGMVVPRYAAPPSGGGGSAGGGGNTYIVNVAAGVAANGAEIGARVVKAIKEYEQSNGAGWRRP
jgi:hypothetical protein